MIMVSKPSARNVLKHAGLLALVTILLAACAPGISPEQVQMQVQTGVAQTVEAQNGMATSVAMTVAAMIPTATLTPSPTDIPLDIPTLTPVIPIASVTPFVSSGGGGGSSTKAKYACDVQTRPFDNTAYKPGDPFDIKWIITNTGTATWEAGKDLEYYSGPQMTTHGGVQLPEMEPGDTYTLTADANAPEEKGFHVMTWKLEGGFCWPYVAIYSGK
jgi:Ig-like domain from next to BRCA1 gene